MDIFIEVTIRNITKQYTQKGKQTGIRCLTIDDYKKRTDDTYKHPIRKLWILILHQHYEKRMEEKER